jgi:GNAT superfamily N-acetyltransferase
MTLDNIAIRPAAPADRPAILGIAAQIWEGGDYLPDVIDDWLKPGPAELIVATVDERVVGLGRYVAEFPRFAWLEGLRVDPQLQGKGIAKALTAAMVEKADRAGAELVALSTYLDNYASQKVSAAFGFEQAVGFAYCEGKPEAALRHAVASARVTDVPRGEALAFVAASRSLRAGAGYLPHSWRFYPFDRGPEIALGAMERLLGIRDAAGGLAALLCLGDRSPHGATVLSIDFLEGEQEAMAELVRHALTLARGEKYLEAMVPCEDEVALPSLLALTGVGFEVWNEGKADVLVYERRRG